MFESEQYELVDFGEGRRLERFGPYLIDRPCPAATSVRPMEPSRWKDADCRYTRVDRQRGKWKRVGSAPDTWQVRHGDACFAARLTPPGQVGLFPEQAENWDWLRQQVRRSDQPLRVLNLFAYTGGSTLAAAAAGAEVTHIDAAANVVKWARSNAELSGLAEAPIRWITEDARKFVQREIKRGNQYQGIILDPPSYGHGPHGEGWKIQDDLLPLLRACGQLCRDQLRIVLLTCHSPGFGAAELEACLMDTLWGHCQAGVIARTLYLRTADGRRLPSGTVARWPSLSS
ncbi:MAG: class I SAM-dependent methyltransferase [Planctomycetales bacterium]|nr:class I SAM-dependent methyltransferase [Planctomycetales bacterium]